MEKGLTKYELLKLKIILNICMCVVSAFLIFVLPMGIIQLNIKQEVGLLLCLGSLFIMPWILFGITCIFWLVYKFRKNVDKGIRKMYMNMPGYYILITIPFCLMVLCIIGSICDKYI